MEKSKTTMGAGRKRELHESPSGSLLVRERRGLWIAVGGRRQGLVVAVCRVMIRSHVHMWDALSCFVRYTWTCTLTLG